MMTNNAEMQMITTTRKSDDDAQKILPIILAYESNAPNPVAIAPIISGSKLLAAIS